MKLPHLHDIHTFYALQEISGPAFAGEKAGNIMTSTQINCFIASAETKSFTIAASKLYMSQSALSRSVASLESELGLTLFVREKNTIKLTSAGKDLYGWACDSKNRLKEITEKARNGQSNGSLTIGYVKNEQLTEQFQTHILKFREASPGTELRFVLHENARDLLNALKNGSVDIAFLIESALDYATGFAHYTIGTSPYVAAVSVLHPLMQKEIISFKELENEDFVTIRREQSPAMVDKINEIADQFGFTPRIRERNGIDEVLDTVIGGIGVVLLYGNHSAVHNKMLHILRFRESLDVKICFAINPDNANPNIPLIKKVLLFG